MYACKVSTTHAEIFKNYIVTLAIPTCGCGAYIALFVVVYVRGYNYTVTVFFINKTDGFSLSYAR